MVDFAPIIAELYTNFGDVSTLSKLNILELGPGRKINLAKKIGSLELAKQFQCVGLPKRKTGLGYYIHRDINEYLSSLKNRSLDLIYSRFVMEENSFHPLALLHSSAFWRMIIKGKKRETLLQLPGSLDYIHSTYELISKKLRPGGVVVSMLVDRYRCGFVEKKMQRHFQVLNRLALGGRMGLLTLKKR